MENKTKMPSYLLCSHNRLVNEKSQERKKDRKKVCKWEPHKTRYCHLFIVFLSLVLWFNVCASILDHFIVYFQLKLFACMSFSIPSSLFLFVRLFGRCLYFIFLWIFAQVSGRWLSFLILSAIELSIFVHNCNRSWIHLMSMNTVYVFSQRIQVWIYELRETCS